jgi:hydroxymethylpyrimidine pyrophosphatase-like HAD family hydrolase
MAQGTNAKKIIILDFDLTLTSVHSNGLPTSNPAFKNPQTLFTNTKGGNNLQEFKYIFAQLLEANYKIYINTRGLADEVRECLKALELDIYITKVYGAKTSLEISFPEFTKEELDVTQLEYDSFEDCKIWPVKKYVTNYKIMLEEKLTVDDIIFIDDQKNNVEWSKHKFYRSYLVGSSTDTLALLFSLIY